MRININFSIEVPPEYRDALIELSAGESLVDARQFIKGEAQDQLIGYLTDNGVVGATVTRDSMTTY